MAGLQSPEGDLLCIADSWRVANELSNASATPDSAGWFSVADGSVSGPPGPLYERGTVAHRLVSYLVLISQSI